MIRITNVQRMCFDDGPGIRTTVFLKGCGIHCPWCSNPENLTFAKQEYSLPNEDGVMHGCYGRDYSWEELKKIMMKDNMFWGKEGGVTFSGGEALLQALELEPLMKSLKESRISMGVETSLFVPRHLLELSARYIDFYYVDVKILDKELCKTVLGGDIDLYQSNVEWLSNHTNQITFRVPCSKEYVLQDNNRKLLCGFLSRYSQFPVEIFSVHHLGDKKYQALGRQVPDIEPVADNDLSSFQEELKECGSEAKIIQI